MKYGVLTVAQSDRWCLCCTETQVSSPAWHSDLRIWLQPWCGPQLQLGSDPGPGNFHVPRGTQKRENEKICGDVYCKKYFTFSSSTKDN